MFKVLVVIMLILVQPIVLMILGLKFLYHYITIVFCELVRTKEHKDD